MPYTVAQLSAYYQSLTGFAPTGADLILIQAASQQNQQGTASDTNTLLQVFNAPGVQATFEVGVSVYTFFNTPVTGGGLSQGGIAFFNNYLNTPPSAGGISNFNLENRYYNLAVSAASAGSSANANFVANYGSLTIDQTVRSAYETIIGTSTVGQAAANAAIADILSRVGYFTQVANERAGGPNAGGAAGQQIALKAIIIGYILEEANKADVGTYARAIDQFEAAVAAGNAQFGSNVLTTYSNNGSGFNSGFAALGASGLQTNFALTTGIDTFQPTTGNFQFVGVVNQAGNTTQFNPSTLQAGDQVRGTGGNNTLTIDTVGTVGDATGGALISGIQTINIRAVQDPQTGGAANATLDATLVPGATQINSFVSRGPVTVNNVAGSTSVGIVGDGSAVGGLFTANYNATATTATLNLANGTTAGSSATVTGAGLVTVNVNSNGGLNTLTNLTLPAAATTLNIASTSALTVTGATTATGITTITASGSGSVNLGPTQIGTAVTSINTTGLTGTGALTATIGAPATALNAQLGVGSDNITINGNLATGTNLNTGGGTNRITVNGNLVGSATIIGGTQADAITVTGNLSATSVINTSGGGDTVTVGVGAGTITPGATINGGGGNSTFVTDGADFQAISNTFTTAQRGAITGFSTVGITDALTAGTVYDVNAIGAQNFTTVGVVAAGTATLNAASGAAVTFVDNLGGFGGGNIQTNTGTLNINLANAATNTADVLNLGVTGANGNANLNVTVNNVETINVTANRAAGAAFTNATPVLTLAGGFAAPAATTVTLAGTESITFNPVAAHTALRTITSTSTANVQIDVSAISNASTGAGNVSNGTAANPLIVTTGSGVDTVTVRDFVRVTTDGGNDLVNVGITANGNSYSTYVDGTAGDRVFLQGANQTVTAANVAAKITLQPTAVFQDYLDAATNAGRAIGEVSSFDFGGNTFLVVNNNAAGTFQNGSSAPVGTGDSLIQLVGIHTVGSIAAGVVTLGS